MSRKARVTSAFGASSTLDDEPETLEKLRLRRQNVDGPQPCGVLGKRLLARVRAEPVGATALDLDRNPLALPVVPPLEHHLLRQARRGADRGECDDALREVFLAQTANSRARNVARRSSASRERR